MAARRDTRDGTVAVNGAVHGAVNGAVNGAVGAHTRSYWRRRGCMCSPFVVRKRVPNAECALTQGSARFVSPTVSSFPGMQSVLAIVDFEDFWEVTCKPVVLHWDLAC